MYFELVDNVLDFIYSHGACIVNIELFYNEILEKMVARAEGYSLV